MKLTPELKKRIDDYFDNISAEEFKIITNKYLMKKLTLNDLQTKYKDFLTIGKLRKFIEDNKELEDDTKVLVERVNDMYFDKHDWPVYLQEGLSYYNAEKFNESMDEEIEIRAKGLEPEYPLIENPELAKTVLSDDLKEQFHPAWCITKNKEGIVLIYNHY